MINETRLKIIIIGNSFTGKSSIASCYTKDVYQNDYNITIGVDYFTKKVTYNNINYKLQIWDTAGSETYNSLIRSYYRNTDGCILVYDITNKKSFDNIVSWLKEFRKMNDDENISFVLVGNKKDISNSRVISYNTGNDFAKSNNLLFCETSAKNKNDITHCFDLLLNDINKKNLHNNNDINTLEIESNEQKQICIC